MNVVVDLLLEIPVAIASTLLAVRLLGVRRSWVAITVAGVVGWSAGNLLQVALADWDWDAAELSARTFVFSVVFTMLTAVALDFVARPGSLARGNRAGLIVVPHPVRDVRRHLAPYARYLEIARIARRNGLSFGAGIKHRGMIDRSFGVRLRKTLEESGIVFVKLGQMASTRDDLLPLELTKELRKLQSQVEPAPRDAMQAALESELGEPVESFFEDFDWTPIGSASVAQVYAARLKTGEDVIVKVQRPDIDEIVARDSMTLLHLARALEQRTRLGRDLHAVELAEEFVRTLKEELDFLLEAVNTGEIADAVAATGTIRIPYVHRELVTRRVLVEERFHGTSVGESTRIDELGCERRDLADRLVRSVVDQLTYGRFHADPHPGNVLLLDDGSLGLIDFGMTGHLDSTQRAALFQMTMATATGDAVSLRDAIEQIAVIGSTMPDAALERALSRLLATKLRAGRPVSATAMNDLIALLSTFDIYLPAELTMCMRTLALLDGTVRAIDPDYALVDGLLRIVDISPIGLLKSTGQPLREQINEELVRQLPRMQRIPSQIERITTLMARGELRTSVSMFSAPEDSRVITTLVNRLVFALAGGTIIVGSAVLLTVGDTTGGGTSLPEVFGYMGLAIGTIFILRVIAAVIRDGYE